MAPVAAEETEGFRGREARQGAPAPRLRRGPGGANQGRNFPVMAAFYHVFRKKMLRRNKFCAAGGGMKIPLPAPRQLAEPAQKPEGLWSGQKPPTNG